MPTATILAAYSRNSNQLAASPAPGDLTAGRGGDGNGYRSQVRWDLAGQMPSGSTVTRVRLRLNESVINGDVSAQSWYWGPYNGGTGSTNPASDNEATRHTRSDVSSTNYGIFTDYRSTGLHTIELGSPAISDVQARFDAAGSFALAVRQTPDEAGSPAPRSVNWDPFDGGSPPALLVDYTEPAEPEDEEDEFEFQEIEALNQTELAIWNRALSLCGDFRLTFGSAKTVSAATAANPVVCTSTAHGFSNGDLVVHSGFDQMTELNARVFRVENVTANTYELADEDGTTYTAETSGGIARKLTESSAKQAKALFDAWPNVRDQVLRGHPWNCTMKRDRLARLATAVTITGATKANPCVITAAAHGLVQGDTIVIDRVLGMVELNDRYHTVGTVPSSSTFQLAGIDSTLFTTYSSAGRLRKALIPLRPDFDFSYRYDLPSDCLRLVEVSNMSLESWEVVANRIVYTDEGITVPIRYQRRERDTTLWDSLLRKYVAYQMAFEICEELTQSNTKKEALRKELELVKREAKMIDAQEQSVNAPRETEWERARD